MVLNFPPPQIHFIVQTSPQIPEITCSGSCHLLNHRHFSNEMCEGSLVATSVTIMQLLSTIASDSHFLLIVNKWTASVSLWSAWDNGAAIKLKWVQQEQGNWVFWIQMKMPCGPLHPYVCGTLGIWGPHFGNLWCVPTSSLYRRWTWGPEKLLIRTKIDLVLCHVSGPVLSTWHIISWILPATQECRCYYHPHFFAFQKD